MSDLELTGVDVPVAEYRKPLGFFVTLTVDELDEAARMFAALAEGGDIRLAFSANILVAWSSINLGFLGN